MGNTPPVVALIHATPASVAPAHAAFAADFADARLWNLLDDHLISEAEAAGGLTADLHQRMHTLLRYAVNGGADAILLTCSMYGPAARDFAPDATIPVLASDQALFDEVDRLAAQRITVLGPVRTGVDDTVARLREHLSTDPAITGSVIDGARAATTARDHQALERAVVDATLSAQAGADLILLGQFSISPAQPAAQRAVTVPVLSPPQLAAQRLRRHFTGATA
ncbi:hypothetical protein Ait01nite_017780 [Actinoplanes italicus]|uniref:Asp/Glu/hydantoin racemase n=1 Tax=Actinoplanes italicus TaxID=113567 RepID=A0A2T0JZM3_9ACTN|nr:hypothetical protein [Actinoplanes italicus]PRX15933.1 hypothetical protein CLV67_122173 [Actinoplanes italicus]GIE28733.1 hypothetical protein Ait01nite_017780 [Actinoplanes italicus]